VGVRHEAGHDEKPRNACFSSIPPQRNFMAAYVTTTPESCGQMEPHAGFALPLGFLTGTNPELILVRRTKEPKICGSYLSP
jgi:hypothetical protein